VALVEQHAAEVGARSVWVAGRDFGCESNRVAVGGRLVTLYTPDARYEDILVPLHGAHQGRNAACALAAAEAFFGRPLNPDVVEAAFDAVRVPGRLEVLGRRPLLLVDGAHNVAGMIALGEALAEEFTPYSDTVAVIGMLSGRDPLAMLEGLRPAGVTSVVACQPNSPRAMPADIVADAGRSLGLAMHVVPDVTEALSFARGLVDADGMIVVAGSMYVVGDARVEILSGAVRWEDAGD
jgi:dihydrofolate synthase/folylpolyglutamate synthase